jgi:hypothetical protein
VCRIGKMKNIGGACKIGKMKNTKNFYWKT